VESNTRRLFIAPVSHCYMPTIPPPLRQPRLLLRSGTQAPSPSFLGQRRVTQSARLAATQLRLQHLVFARSTSNIVAVQYGTTGSNTRTEVGTAAHAASGPGGNTRRDKECLERERGGEQKKKGRRGRTTTHQLFTGSVRQEGHIKERLLGFVGARTEKMANARSAKSALSFFSDSAVSPAAAAMAPAAVAPARAAPTPGPVSPPPQPPLPDLRFSSLTNARLHSRRKPL
jgi:hypothetical protein